MSDYLDPNNEELLKDFFSEAQMQVELMEQNILALEDDPGDHDAIDEIFRAAHTLKGGSATVQMDELSSFTHLLEDLLDEIRGGNVTVTEENIDVLLSSIDVIKAMLESRTQGSVYDEDYSGVSANLELMIAKKEEKSLAGKDKDAAEASTAKPMEQVAKPAAKETPEKASALTEYEKLEMKEAIAEGESAFRIRVYFDEANPMNSVGGIQVFAKMKEFGQILKTVPDFDSLYEDVFHPVVDYFIATKSEPAELESSVWIEDVTTGISVSGIDEEPEGGEGFRNGTCEATGTDTGLRSIRAVAGSGYSGGEGRGKEVGERSKAEEGSACRIHPEGGQPKNR